MSSAAQHISVLITDMEGSTAFTDARGDEAAIELIREHERIVRSAIAAHGAREIKSMGDGFMIAFASPAKGIACALEILGGLRVHNDAHPDRPLNVRMGMNTGPAIEEAGDLYGTTVNVAARIAAKARSGQLLVPDAVREIADGDWTFVDRGLFWLKGLKQQWRLYEATREPVAVYRPAISEGRTPFVDRESERARIRLHLDGALEGRGGVVILAGDPGSGKSRLADEMGAEAQGRGMHYLAGRCYEMSQTQPYTPLVETLEAAERRLEPAAFRTALGEAAGEIARLLPQIRRRYENVPPAADLPPDEARRFLHVSVRDVLASMAAVRPLCIVWDDLHWADDQTVTFFEFLAEALSELPILLIGTYTHAELTPARPLRGLIETMHRRRVGETFEVGTLRLEDVNVLLSSIAGAPPPPALVSRLYEDTEGNVFFFEEVVRHLTERGRLFDQSGRWRDDVARLDLEVPETLRLTITRRLEHLSEDARSVLARAGLIGRGFGFDLIELVCDLGEDELLDVLDEAERARLITSTIDAGVVQFRFSHELIRQTLVSDVSPARRQRLHKRIADAMETVYEHTLVQHAATIVYQLEHAGRPEVDRIARLSVIAGDRALEAAAFDEALRHYERAFAATPTDDRLATARLRERIAAANRSRGRNQIALETWREAIADYAALGEPAHVARVCLDAGLQVAFWYRAGEMLEFVHRGLDALGEQGTSERGGLLALWGAHASQRGAYDDAVRLLDEAIEIAREHDDVRVLGLALYSRCVHHFNYHEHTEAIAFGTESIEHLRASSDLWTLANVLGYVASSYQWQGQFEPGRELGSEAVELALRLGNWSAWTFGNRPKEFVQFAREPSIEWYEADGRRALEIGEEQGYRWLSALGHTRLALASFWAGRWEESLRSTELALEIEARGAVTGYESRLMLVHAYLGHRDEALSIAESIEGRFAVPGRPNTATSQTLAHHAVEAFVILGERERAAALYPVVTDTMAKGCIARGLDWRLLQILAGAAAWCGGDWAVARDHFEEALRLTQTLPLRLEEPEAQRFYVGALIEHGDAADLERARVLGAEAIASYCLIGMPRHEALVASMLEQL
jgi:class 3 adenylate cyclase/tetratricopeptide (TPR) repeat protein